MRNIAARGNVFYLEETGIVEFRQGKEGGNSVSAFTAYGEHASSLAIVKLNSNVVLTYKHVYSYRIFF